MSLACTGFNRLSGSASSPQNYVRPLLWSTAIAIAVYGAAITIGNPSEVWTAVSSVGGITWLEVLALLLFSYAVRFWRWQRYLKCLGCAVPTKRSLAYYIGGFAFTTTPGKAGEAIRSLYLKNDGVAYTSSLAALFAERFIDVVVLILLATSVALDYESARWLVAVMATAAVLALPIVHNPRFHHYLEALINRLIPRKYQAAGVQFTRLLQSSSRLLRAKTLFEGLVLGLVAWWAEGFILYIILSSMQSNLSPLLIVSIWATSMLAGAASLLPGGLGSTEAVMSGLLILVGVDASIAIAATVAYRVTTLWLAVLIGLSVISALEFKAQSARKQKSKETPKNAADPS
ncbi:MAG: flippase-like domain-containing protein [Proteobacteria bacterium]|nr:flippase-like domain-containing protein [Pseudomonadota bacterium]